jgi:hypothetical protein
MLTSVARADDAVVSHDATPVRATAVATPPAEVHQRLGTQKTVAAVAMSAGGASLVLGTIFGVATITTWGNAEGDCAHGCSPTSAAQSEKSQATTEATVSTVGFVTGAVLLVGGMALWLTAPGSKEAGPSKDGPKELPPERPTERPGVAVVPGLGGLTILGRF